MVPCQGHVIWAVAWMFLHTLMRQTGLLEQNGITSNRYTTRVGCLQMVFRPPVPPRALNAGLSQRVTAFTRNRFRGKTAAEPKDSEGVFERLT